MLACDGRVGIGMRRSSWYWHATVELVVTCDGRVGVGVVRWSWYWRATVELVLACHHRRTGQHPFAGGGQTEFSPNGFSGGG